MFFFGFLLMDLGIEHETLAENDRYRLAQLWVLPKSGGESDYALFKKMPVGERRVYKGAGHIQYSTLRLLERDSIIGIEKPKEDAQGALDTIWIKK